MLNRRTRGYLKAGASERIYYPEDGLDKTIYYNATYSKFLEKHERGHSKHMKRWLNKYYGEGYSKIVNEIKPCHCSKIKAVYGALVQETKVAEAIRKWYLAEFQIDNEAVDKESRSLESKFTPWVNIEGKTWVVLDKKAIGLLDNVIEDQLKREPVYWNNVILNVQHIKLWSLKTCIKGDTTEEQK